MNVDNTKQETNPAQDMVFALDIGTRSIIGIVGVVENEKIKIIAIEKEEHTNRAMIDGQIENIDQVAKVARTVKERLEKRLDCSLTRVCVAAAGRALKTEKASYELTFPQMQQVDEEIISKLEAGAITNAETAFSKNEGNSQERQFYLVGYTISQYYLDNYPISCLIDHHGKKLRAEVIATFLPSEVVESLYITMRRIGLEVASLTLEPIAAINAAIPQNIRLLNLVLVDIGAGTSDIAVCRDGSVVGYTMATIAGDEITESLMKEYLIDFATAEKIKFELETSENISFSDILGFEHTISSQQVFNCITDAKHKLCKEICDRIIEVNDGAPSAIFLAGGGSKLSGICEEISECLGMDIKRVAIAGNNFQFSSFSNEYNIDNPEYATPLGIAISAGMNLINDSFRVTLNGSNAKLFRSGSLNVRDVLMMNGFTYQDLIGLSGTNLVVTVDGKRTVIYGSLSSPAVLKVNGEDAKISDIVHAGDFIDFEPATHGEPANACVSDIIEDKTDKLIAVNGDFVDLDATLKSGDIIETFDNNIQLKETNSKPVAENIDSTENIEPKKEKTVSSEIDKIIPKPVEKVISNETVTHPRNMIHFTMNGKPLALESKKDGRPYFLMDMLQYSNIDFDNPEGEVVLRVNGLDSYFQKKLKDKDIVDIYCVKRQMK